MTSREVAASPEHLIAQAREKFLARGSADPFEVRGPILASWRRSRKWKVPADQIGPPGSCDSDLGVPLARSGAPVLHRLRENLAGQPVSVLLADAHGVVLSRMTADDDLERHLDDVMLAPGFSCSESEIGTNGIGAALEGGQPAPVVGHEHYAQALGDLTSAGIPIHHPISGKLAGAAGLICWRDFAGQDADPLLMTLLKMAADQVTQALLRDSTEQQLALLQGYLRVCRQSGGIVLALNHDLVMMNDQARYFLEQGDQEVLLGRAGEVLTDGRASTVQIDLPTGLTAQLHCRPAANAAAPEAAGGVMQVKLLGQARPNGDAPAQTRMYLPSIVGSGALWQRSSERVQMSYERGEWLALEGEPGVGKLALARAVHQCRNPARRFDVFDAADEGSEDWLTSINAALLAAEGDLVIRHVDQLGPNQAQDLAAVLRQARPASEPATWVAVTQTRGSTAGTELLRLFPATVTLPPLRHHICDLPELVQYFLGKLTQQDRLTCSPEAMKLLIRSSWPGNVEQLRQVIRDIVQRRRAGSIRPGDLPPECWTVSRRLLSTLEALERDAIVQALLDTDGNKVRAAEALGMSRASIYRKIYEFGIVVPSGLSDHSRVPQRSA